MARSRPGCDGRAATTRNALVGLALAALPMAAAASAVHSGLAPEVRAAVAVLAVAVPSLALAAWFGCGRAMTRIALDEDTRATVLLAGIIQGSIASVTVLLLLHPPTAALLGLAQLALLAYLLRGAGA